MDWALDQSGNLVDASGTSLYSHWFTCPACRERVFLRSGSQRRPHFAHYGHRGKPECENYHPSLPGSKNFPHPSLGEKSSQTGSTLHGGGIYLELRDKGRFYLHVKLPQLPVGTDVTGEIRIKTLGERSYTSTQLQRPCYEKVHAPRLPLLEIVSTDELTRFGQLISSLVQSFGESNNYFKTGESWEKLLWPGEPLEWGEQYYLLTKYELSQVLKDYDIHVDCKIEQRGWNLYEIILPKITQLRSEQWKETVQRYLGRELRNPHPKVYFVAPPPHHIEPDGTYVFQNGTERIVINNTWNSSISIKYGLDIDCQALVDSKMEAYTDITNIKTGSFSILVNGHEALLGRVEECPLFQPDGVTVTTGSGMYEIFQSGLANILLLKTVDSIICPNQRVADNLDLSIYNWSQVGSTFIPLREKWQEVDTGNFGFLALPIPSEESEHDVVAIDARVNAKRKWVEGLVVRLYGPKMLNQLCKQWDSPYSTNYCNELAWLWPHIECAQSR
jgi:competence protein CoiA-like protein